MAHQESTEGLAADIPVVARPYRELAKSRSFLLIWSGLSVSSFGDACFNVAVMWLVFAQTGSILQTATVQVVWQLSDALFAPLAGIAADRWDRTRVLVIANLAAAAVVLGLTGGFIADERPSLGMILTAIFVLNCISTFMGPASYAIMPRVVGHALLATAFGFLAAGGQLASLLGTSAAGLIVERFGGAWALAIDAGTFLLAGLAVAAMRLPRQPSPEPTGDESTPSLLGDLRQGWAVIRDRPVIKALVWLGLMVNVASFTGALTPALVRDQLDAGAAIFGFLEAAGIIGGLTAGVAAGGLERRFGVGRLLVWGFVVVGASVVAMALSRVSLVTIVLEAIAVFALTVGAISLNTLIQVTVPDAFLGRVNGILRSLAVISIPPSALLAGWTADQVGVVPVFAFAGMWVLGCAVYAFSTQDIWQART